MPLRSPPPHPASAWPLLALVLFALPLRAEAGEVSLKIEPDVAIPVSKPQSELFGAGGGESMKVLFGITPWLDIGPTASFQLLPGRAAGTDSGTIWGLGGGLRLKRSHAAESGRGISPWFDADVFYVRTGTLNRPGFDAAIGASVPVGETRSFWIGPFVRYLQVVQAPDRAGFDNRDSRTLAVGLTLEVSSGIKREPAPVAEPVVVREVAPCPACEPVLVCSDRDKDGMPDSVDRCPDVVGLVEDWGCPVYKNIVVHEGRIELKEKIYFAFDLATIEEVSYRVLDDVVQAMKDGQGFRVDIGGHTDSAGSDAYNQGLSERRAGAVVDYLVAHGVPKERLTSKGFGESVPIDDNKTVSGRENNRRVEFLVQPTTATEGGAK